MRRRRVSTGGILSPRLRFPRTRHPKENNMLRKLLVPLLTLATLGLTTSAVAAGKTSLTWYGHAAFKIVTPQGHVIVVDPYSTNPSHPKGKEDLAALTKVDLILVTHGHGD